MGERSEDNACAHDGAHAHGSRARAEDVTWIVNGAHVFCFNSCPRFEQCRCDVYGWCGPLPSGESFQAVISPA